MVNPLHLKSELQILLCLTPDDFTRQRETPKEGQGWRKLTRFTNDELFFSLKIAITTHETKIAIKVLFIIKCDKS